MSIGFFAHVHKSLFTCSQVSFDVRVSLCMQSFRGLLTRVHISTQSAVSVYFVL